MQTLSDQTPAKSSKNEVQFGRVPYDIFDSGMYAQLKPLAQAVYTAICLHVDRDWKARVGMRRINKLVGEHYLLGSISRSVSQLIDAGLLEAHRENEGQAFTYRVVTEVPAKRSLQGERSGNSKRSPQGERSRSRKKAKRSPSSDRSVHPTAQKRSPQGEQYIKNRDLTDGARCARPATGKPLLHKEQGPDIDPLFDALARCHSWQYERNGRATARQLEQIAEAQQALEGKGATPGQVLDRYRWLKRNDGRLGLAGLVQFWEFAGECLENGIEPGSRRSHTAAGDWNPAKLAEESLDGPYPLRRAMA